MQKLQVDDLKGESETLLIPLHYRVQEGKMGSSSYKDDIAERFHDAIDYEWEKFQGSSSLLQRLGIVSRTAILDDQVKAFVASNPERLIVNLSRGVGPRRSVAFSGQQTCRCASLVDRRRFFSMFHGGAAQRSLHEARR
jgi:O-methyltransferase involved in polyketide biosynthesis